MTSRLPSVRMVLVVALLAICVRTEFAVSALRLPRSASSVSPGRQLPPPAARPAQPAQGRDRTRAAPGTAVIRGHVFAADTRAPLRRARITWSSDAPGGAVALADSALVVVTNDRGEYEIRGLSAGRYHVLARHGGYLQMEFAARRATGATRGPVADRDRGVTIDVLDGQSYERADFYLPRAAAITGRVADEFGDPVVGATVEAGRVETAGGRRRMIAYASDMTDDLGEYRLYGLPPGSYYLLASAPSSLLAEADLAYPDTFYPGAARRDQAKLVAVSIGQELADIDFALSPMHLARIEGLVRSSNGTVPRGGLVTVTHISETGVNQTTATSGLGPDGNFSVRRVVPGEILLTANVSGSRVLEEVAALRLLVGGDDITGLFITTGELGTVTVNVKTDTGVPLPFPTSLSGSPVRVTAKSIDDGADGAGVTREYSSRSTAAATTRSFMAPVRPGARLIGLAGLPAGWGVVAVTPGTVSPVETKPNTGLSVQVTISNRLPEISGNAVDQQGRPVWEYSVVLLPRDSLRCFPGSPLVRNERTDQRGEFHLAQLTPGDYQMVAVSIEDDVDLGDPEALERLRARSTPITVTYGDRKTLRLTVTRNSE